MEFLEGWILTLTIFAPVVGAVLIALLPREAVRAVKAVATAAALVSLVLAALVVAMFFAAGPTGDYVLEQDVAWIGGAAMPGVDIRYHVGVDGISVFLLALGALLLPLAVVGSFGSVMERRKEFYVLLLLLGGACMGVFCAMDLLLFYIFFEFTLLPLYFLIGIWGSQERRRAATMFFIYTIAGSLLTFAGVLFLAVLGRQETGVLSFDIRQLAELGRSGAIGFAVQAALFWAMFAGFAIKVPLFPLHTWLPLAHTEAPTAGSVMLAGLLLKLGSYGFLRFCLPILPEASFAFAPFLGLLAVIAIVYGALAAWAQRDFKRLVAYTSVSHMGFVMLGMFALKPVGVAGSVLYMVNHGISTAALFFVVGMIYERVHTRSMDEVGGLAERMPVLTAFAVLFGLSAVALPGLNGFVSEFMVLLAAFTSEAPGPMRLGVGPIPLAYGVVAAFGIVLSAVYILYLLRRVFFGPVRLPERYEGAVRDVSGREIGVMAPLAVLVVLIGLWPGPMIDGIMPAATDVSQAVLMRQDDVPAGAMFVDDERAALTQVSDVGERSGASAEDLNSVKVFVDGRHR